MQDRRAAAFVTRLVLMAADVFIQFRVTPEEKALVRALAAREQITESALVKQLLTTTLRSASLQGLQAAEPVERPSRDSRLYVRLDPEDRPGIDSAIERPRDRAVEGDGDLGGRDGVAGWRRPDDAEG